MNRKLKDQIERFQRFEYTLYNSGRNFSFDVLNEFLKGYEGGNEILSVIEKDVEDRSDIKDTTRRAHSVIISRIRKFGRIVLYSDLTHQNIQVLDDWLRGKNYDKSTIQSTHKIFRTYIKRVWKKEMIELDRDPYIRFKIKGPGPSDRKYLTEEELKMIEDKIIDNERLAVVRDMFVFCCYTGVAYGDVVRLTKENLVNVEDEVILRIQREKTNESASIPLLPKAKAIMTEKDLQQLLPVKSNQKMNAYLKEIATLCNVQTDLTTHVARHTFATTVLLMNGVSLESTQRMLGHSSIKTTEIYAKIAERRLIDEMKKLKEKL